MKKADLTCIIATYNRAHLLEKSLDSVLYQTVPPSQIIVVDDGSTDRTQQVLKSYRGNIETIRQDNSGQAAALNEGLKHANHNWIWLFDDDDIACEDAVDRHFEALHQSKNADFTYSARVEMRTNDLQGVTAYYEITLPEIKSSELLPHLLENCFLHLQGSIIHRRCFQDIGQLREDLTRSASYEFFIRLTRFFHGVPVTGPTYYLRRHSGARGPAKSRFAANDAKYYWHINEKRFFAEIYQELPIDQYSRSIKVSLPPYETRVHPLIARGAAMAGKGLWHLTMRDLSSYQSYHSNTSYDEEVFRCIFGRAFDREHALIDLFAEPCLFAAFESHVRSFYSISTRVLIGKKMYYALRRLRYALGRYQYLTYTWYLFCFIGMNGLIYYVKEKAPNP